MVMVTDPTYEQIVKRPRGSRARVKWLPWLETIAEGAVEPVPAEMLTTTDIKNAQRMVNSAMRKSGRREWRTMQHGGRLYVAHLRPDDRNGA
jgi:hypothetical protein